MTLSPKSSGKTRYVYRSAVNGHFVSKAYAKRYPHLTVKETIGCKQQLRNGELPKGHRLIKKHKPVRRRNGASGGK